MPADRSAQIRQLCDDWLQTATGSGGIQLGAASEAFRLHANGLFPHVLSFGELRAAHVALSRIILLSGYNTIIDFDHKCLWAWEAELLLGTHQGWPRHNTDPDFVRALELVMKVRSAGRSSPNDGSDEYMEQSRILLGLLNFAAHDLLYRGDEIMSYLSFPLLEGLLKRRASAYVTLDGQVIAPFDVPRTSHGRKPYSPTGNNKRINSLRDLLFLEYERVADPDLKSDITELVSGLTTLEPSLSHGFDVIYMWRNTSLHGSGHWPTIGATVVGLTLRILLSELTGDYDTRRDTIVSSIQLRAQHGVGYPNPWQYYPPTDAP